MQNKIEIPLNKSKLVFMLLACIVFCAICVWFFNTTNSGSSPTVLKVLGTVGFAFFGIAALFLAKKIMDKKPGLIIDKRGITDNSNGLMIRLIEWNDITDFEVLKLHRQSLILVKVRKPQKYIDMASNNAQKRLLRLNDKEYGTPVQITAASLKMPFDELLALLVASHPKKKKK